MAEETEMLDYGAEGQDAQPDLEKTGHQESQPENAEQDEQSMQPDADGGDQEQAKHEPKTEENGQGQSSQNCQGQPEDQQRDLKDMEPMSMPPHGTEVFIFRIPREATDAQLKAYCDRAGQVFAIRLPKDPGSPSQNKGYAFCVYNTKEAAEEALTKLHQQELPDHPGRRVNIVKSEVKNKLFVGNLPRVLNKDALLHILESEIQGITGLDLVHDKESGQSRGFGFIEFYNNAAAEAARRHLSRPDFRIHDREVTVTWAEPKRHEAMTEQIKSIYVGNLPDTVDEAKLRSIFSAYGQVTSITILKQPDDPSKLRGYSFVHFADRAHALRVLTDAESGKQFEMDSKPLNIHLARPQAQRDNLGDYDNHGYGRGGYGGFSRGGRGRGVRGGMMGRGRSGPMVSSRGGGRMASVGPPPAYGAPAPAIAYSGGMYEEPMDAEYEEYDDGYGGYGDESMAEMYDDGSMGGMYPGGMTMMPVMMPSGQMALMPMAAPATSMAASAMPPPAAAVPRMSHGPVAAAPSGGPRRGSLGGAGAGRGGSYGSRGGAGRGGYGSSSRGSYGASSGASAGGYERSHGSRVGAQSSHVSSSGHGSRDPSGGYGGGYGGGSSYSGAGHLGGGSGGGGGKYSSTGGSSGGYVPRGYGSARSSSRVGGSSRYAPY